MAKTTKFDDVACIVDNHTGRVKAQYVGLGATSNARMDQKKFCKVKTFGNTSVLTGEAAQKAIAKGRV